MLLFLVNRAEVRASGSPSPKQVFFGHGWWPIRVAAVIEPDYAVVSSPSLLGDEDPMQLSASMGDHHWESIQFWWPSPKADNGASAVPFLPALRTCAHRYCGRDG